MRIDALGRGMPDHVAARTFVLTDEGRRWLAMEWLGLVTVEDDDLRCRNGHRLRSPRGYCAACSILNQRRDA